MDEIRHLGTEVIGDYAEGLLTPVQRGEAEAHFASCAACRSELAAAQAYFGDMASLPVHRAPGRFLSRVHARLDKASVWKRMLALISSPRLLPVPLAALSVVLIGVYLQFVARDAEQSAPQVSYRAPAKEEAPPSPAMAPAAAPEALREGTAESAADAARKDVGLASGGAEAKADKRPERLAALPKRKKAAGTGDPYAVEPLKQRTYAQSSPPVDPETLAKTAPSSRLSGRAKSTGEFHDQVAAGDLAQEASGKAGSKGVGAIASNSAGTSSPSGAAGVAGAKKAEQPVLAEAERPRSEPEALALSSRPRSEERAMHEMEDMDETESLDMPARSRPAAPAKPAARPVPRASVAPAAPAAPSAPSASVASVASVASAEKAAKATEEMSFEESAMPSPDYTLTVDPGRITPEAFRQALKTMGVKAVSPVYGDARLWDLSIPPASLKSVEAYLKTLGKLQVLGKTAPAPPSGAPHRRLARVLFPN